MSRRNVIVVEPLTDKVKAMLIEFVTTKLASWGSYAWQPTCCHCKAPGWTVAVVVDKEGRAGAFTFCSYHANEVKAEMKKHLGPPRQMVSNDMKPAKTAAKKPKKARAT